MIVCHCNVIKKAEIEEVVVSLLDEDAWRLIVPLQVYHAMQKRGRCCACFPNVVDIIIDVTESYHQRQATPEAEIVSLIDELRIKQAQLDWRINKAPSRRKDVRAA